MFIFGLSTDTNSNPYIFASGIQTKYNFSALESRSINDETI
jgi:hypothetical protein